MKYITILICFIVLNACKSEKPKDNQAEVNPSNSQNELILSNHQMEQLELTYTALTKNSLAGTLVLNGKVDLDPAYKVSLSSMLGGHISSINALPGKIVKKGDVIVTLEDPQFIQIQQDYLTTKAQLLSIEPNYLRQKELNRSKSTSDKVMQQAETEYKALLATKHALEEKLKLIHINPEVLTPQNIKRSVGIAAPFDGTINEVFVNKGRYVSPSDVLVELYNTRGILLNINVFEKDLAKIKVGQTIEIFTNSKTEDIIYAKVLSKGTAIGENGSSPVMAELIDKKQPDLIPGMYINARVAIKNLDVLTIPTKALVNYEGKDYVFESENNRFLMHEVKIGETTDDFIEVKNYDSLQHKKIVENGAYALLMALKNKNEE